MALLLCSAFVILSLSKDAFAATVQLPQTGQTTSYSAGDDGDWKAGVAVAQRFTVGAGAQAACVTDNLTGLMWVKTPDSTTRTWQGAIDYAKTLNLCGFTDWRVPTIIELESLGNAEQFDYTGWLNTQGFSNVQSNRYWSSTTYAYDTVYAWFVNMWLGKVDGYEKSNSYYVWSVRGGQTDASADIWETGQKSCYNASGGVVTCGGTEQDADLKPGAAWPSPRFTINGNTGTVTDNLTGLIWLKDANCFGTKTWDQALGSANNLANGQCSLADGSQAGDWRLPNQKEFVSLLDFEYSNPALSNTEGNGKWTAGAPFDGVQSFYYWSSTTWAYDTYLAWYVNMWVGFMDFDSKSYDLYVWPVRGGQSGSSCTYTISPTSQTFTSSGGTDSVTVTVGNSCDWTATEGLDWITITAGNTGTGNGTVSYSVLPNLTGAPRTGNIIIAGQTFLVSQSDSTFADVPSTYWANTYINAIYYAGITSGCGTGNYCPESLVTRGQMAVFVVKALGEQPVATCTGTVFNDVNANMNGGEGFCRYVEKFRELNITAGCAVDNSGTPQNEAAYCPDNNVTRAQMAVFLTKALAQQPAASCTGTVFNDVNTGMNGGDAFCRYIEKFRELNITAGCAANNPSTPQNEAAYCPNNDVTRAQMAVFLTKGFLQ